MKKIDTKKSTVYGTNDRDNVDLWLGIEGFLSHYSDFEPYTVSVLDGFTHNKYMTIEKDPNGCPVEQWYEYFIPTSKAVFVKEKEKKLRPFNDINEFSNKTGCKEIGKDVITIRNKYSNLEYELLFTGYSNDYVHLGGYVLAFGVLLKHYEYALNSFEWLPLGVEE